MTKTTSPLGSLDKKVDVETTVVTDDTTAEERDVYLVDTTSGATTVTLPDPTDRSGDVIYVKDYEQNAGTNAITVGVETGLIDGNASLTLNSNDEAVVLGSNGVEWVVIGYFAGESTGLFG